MSTIVLKGLSPQLHADLKARAKAHRRSLNQEAIGILERTLSPHTIADFKPAKPLKAVSMADILAAIENGRR